MQAALLRPRHRRIGDARRVGQAGRFQVGDRLRRVDRRLRHIDSIVAAVPVFAVGKWWFGL